jgi:cyclopropane fatty-acyl-phospholipid synthase-like methyltransferase
LFSSALPACLTNNSSIIKISDFVRVKKNSLTRRYQQKTVPITRVVEDYIVGDIDLTVDTFAELLKHKHEIFDFKFVSSHYSFLLTKFLPQVIIHSKAQDTRIAQDHYDIGNDFFSWFLGKPMVYTSGIYKTGKETLEQAQQNKIDLIAEKILLQKGDKMLDIGCGWGTLLYNSAKKYGAQVTGVTIAEQGYQYISEQIVKQKLQGKVNVLKIDYRDIPKQKFDKITCVEMAEHVGVKNFNKFMKQIYNLLDDDGIYYQQVAGLKAGLWNMESLVWGLFMNKYIFPGADASMPLKWYVAKLEKAKFEVRSVETIGIHYSRTLNQWHENWLSNEDKILGAYSPYWFRLWDAFLAWSTNIAEEGHATCYQIVAHKNKPKFNRKRFIGKKTFA